MNLTEPRDLAALLEAFLLAAGRPLPLERMAELFEDAERPEPALLRQALAVLEQSCEGRGFELREVASGYRLQVRREFAPWVGRLWEERPQRYSRALLETLALIAYRQPITRGEIEEIRGVAVSSQIVKTLQEREWIRVVGHREVPGRPAMFATTRGFLDHFNLKSLDELPPLAVLRELEIGPASLEEDVSPQAPVAQPAAEPAEQTSFRSLLAELDGMERGLKTDFADLPEPTELPPPRSSEP
ncbi:SMC-Scp complex subunit ScpB [Stutzerimonas tarimensis]|uniref:SMC-Scp complex subunit ScpB n=1 Tax=Stutzerimonas tarimensis TaxID=1507735 RepID=A0ABV7TAT8_9GAMM